METSQLGSFRTRRRAHLVGRAPWRARLIAPGLALALALGACSGGGGGGPVFRDPGQANFDYGAVTDASNLWVVGTLSAWAADARAEVAAPGDASVEYRRAFELAFLATELAAEGPNRVGLTVIPDTFKAFLSDRLPWATCVTASPEEVQYRDCRIVVGGSTVSLQGTLTRSGTTLAWDLRWDWSGEWLHFTGRVEVGEGIVTGQVRTDEVIYDIPFTDAADLVLILDGGGCPAGGTVELKRLWAEPRYVGDAGTLLVWSGCGAVAAATVTH